MAECTDKSFREIAQEVGRDPKTVTNIYNKYHKLHDYESVAPQSGRPPKMTKSNGQRAAFELSRGTATTATELQCALFPDVSAETVRRKLKDKDSGAYKCQEVPYLKPVHQDRRLTWGEDYLLWTTDNWSSVMFSDASKFNVFGSDGNQRCWRKAGQGLDPRYTKKKVPHGGASVMVWGCVTRFGVGRLHRISTRMTSAEYVKILNDDLLGSLSDLDIEPQFIIFQRDGDRKKWTKQVCQFLEKNGIDCLPWPACSPNMNIIKNLWDHLDWQVRARKPRACNAEVLWRYLREEWKKIKQEYIDSLYDSIPTQVQTLVEAKGGNTRF
ncbi:hypothetical protein FRC09_002070 [Ceratobasidium sp. 395]|nr:hypothetical protein FRC09_002070 [Ceratobasidium sp. 395]